MISPLDPIRTQLLVSVQHENEVEAAIRGGADIVDAKDPSKGALGAVSTSTLKAIHKTANHRVPLSFALGELDEYESVWHKPNALSPAQDFLIKAATASTFVKIGFAYAKQNPCWKDAVPLIARLVNKYDCQLVLVGYADGLIHEGEATTPSVGEVLELCLLHKLPLLIDTMNKDGQQLFDHLDPDSVEQIIHAGRDAGISVALAGSLRGNHLTRAANLNPAIVGVRGAACNSSNDRTSPICEVKVRVLKRQLENIHSPRQTSASHAAN